MQLFDRLPTLFIMIVVALAATVHADFSAVALTGTKVSEVGAKLLSLLLIALAIERAVEIYLSNRFAPSDEDQTQHKRRAAMMASMALSLAVSVVGVRLLAQMVQTAPANPVQAHMFDVVDIIVTSLLLSGGADGMHQIVTRALSVREVRPIAKARRTK